MLNNRNLRLVGLFFVTFLIGIPVFGQKKKKKEPEPTKVRKAYHDLTHKYNSYFNADLRMQEVMKSLEAQHQENYNQILPMYKHLALESKSASGGDLDVVIKKAGVAISLHRMSHWTDDSYLLIGQAEYLKGDFQQAEATFNYVISELDPKKLAEAEAKRKKKGKKKSSKKKSTSKKKKKGGLTKVNRPKDKFGNPIEPKVKESPKEEEKLSNSEEEEEKEPNYILKHRPAHKEAFLWLARTKVATENYDEAYIILNRLRRDKEVPDVVLAEVEATEAYAFLKLKEYEKAVAPLERAIELSKDRQQKLRYTYILGQLHQRAGRGQEAYATYEQVLKLRPIYEMEFNTRLSIAKNAYENGEGSTDDAIRDLEKMLKDEKNEEYLDQIYFAMADIELKRNNKAMAINYLKSSVYNNIGNKPQKAEAYYLLAELHFDSEIYTSSKYYYDSTLTVLPKSDERLERVTARSIKLKEIAENIEIITLQDSLIRISKMTDAERMALALQIREDDLKKQQAEKRGNEVKTRRQMTTSRTSLAGGKNTQNIGTWWAYESDNIRKGKKDFEKLWGQRKLTDNWRRSNRKGADASADESQEVESRFAELTSTEVDAIFNKMGVPNTSLKVKQSEDKISEAMATLGPLYRDRLKNDPKAIDILEQLMTRFPENKYKMESAYLLYVLYKEKPNFIKANFYKDLIINTDKESKFAKAILDDNFLEKENLRLIQIQDYYNNAYELFERGNVKTALEKIDNVDQRFAPKENPLKPKFVLLAALCEGNLNGKEAYKIGLNEVVKTYPKTEEAKKAKEILKYLDNEGTAAATSTTTAVEDGLFSSKDGTHFFIAFYDSEEMDRNSITAKFADYNKKYHSLERLRVNSIYLDLQTPVLVIKRFKNKDEAMMYYDKVIDNVEEYLKDSMKDLNIVPMVISQDNYKTLVRKKVAEEYKAYFENSYN